MQQNPVTMPHAARCQASGCRLDPSVEFGPGPGGVAPDQRGSVRKSPRGLDQQMRQIGRWDRRGNQRNGSRIDT
jgi:hypothetical protein